jgi:hypothetical protein
VRGRGGGEEVEDEEDKPPWGGRLKGIGHLGGGGEDFNILSHFHVFCRMKYYKFFNSVLTKDLKIHASILGFFYFNISQIFKKN